VCLLVLAHPGSHGHRAVKRLLFSVLHACVITFLFATAYISHLNHTEECEH